MMILLHLVCLRRVVLEEEEKLPKLRTPSLSDDMMSAHRKVEKI